MKEFVESGNYRIGPTRDFQIEMELSVVNELIPIIAARNWSLLRASRDTGGFITCDHPACLNWIKPGKGPYPPGLGLANTSLVFPLTRGLCILGEMGGRTEVVDVDFMRVALVNGAIVANAELRVFASDDMFVFLANRDDVTARGVGTPAWPRWPCPALRSTPRARLGGEVSVTWIAVNCPVPAADQPSRGAPKLAWSTRILLFVSRQIGQTLTAGSGNCIHLEEAHV